MTDPGAPAGPYEDEDARSNAGFSEAGSVPVSECGSSAELQEVLRGARAKADVFPLPLPPPPVASRNGARSKAARFNRKWEVYEWVREIIVGLNEGWDPHSVPYVMQGEG